MIELAPNRKQGLTLANPIIAGSGSVGFGHEAKDLIALDPFGAIVTSPISLRPRRGNAQPRLIEMRGGLLLNHGDQNAGWHRVLEKFGGAWARSKAPIIVHLAGHVSELIELAKRVEGTRGVAGVEIDIENEEMLSLLSALRVEMELPILARLPYASTPFASLTVEAGADALVCIAPPRGAAMDFQSGRMIEGEIYGPLVKPLALKTLQDVSASTSVPLIGAGGIHSKEDVNEFLAVGASAVMVDSLAWIDPRAVNEILGI